jgi:hypothetical protein
VHNRAQSAVKKKRRSLRYDSINKVLPFRIASPEVVTWLPQWQQRRRIRRPDIVELLAHTVYENLRESPSVGVHEVRCAGTIFRLVYFENIERVFESDQRSVSDFPCSLVLK